MSQGTFALTDLYGFWLPLYQFISAVVNVFLGNGFYAGKIVSALFGIGSCLLIYSITLRLTASHRAALLGFALIALNPLHITYSASAMTDVPHAFFVLASLYFVLQRGWVLAAVFAALAGLTRVESWMFIALIPAIQFLKERRISITALFILVIPPLFWFYISWKATGNWLACFVQRQYYHDWLLAMNPALAHFSLSGVLRDSAILIISTDIAVLISAFVAGWIVVEASASQLDQSRSAGRFANDSGAGSLFLRLPRSAGDGLSDASAADDFPSLRFASLQSGHSDSGLDVPESKTAKAAVGATHAGTVIALCVFDASIQLVGSVGSLNQTSAQRAVADYLHAHFDPNSNAFIFSDEGTVSVMSGIPEQKFLTSSDAPRDREGFS